jgi:hypothetical protein
MMSRTRLQVLSSEHHASSALRLVRIAHALGVEAELQAVSRGSTLCAALQAITHVTAVAVSADLLRTNGHLDIEAFDAALAPHVRCCLIFDIWGTDAAARAAARATSGPFAIDYSTPRRYAICTSARDVVGPFAGLEGDHYRGSDVPVYRTDTDLDPSPGESIVEVDGRPVFVRRASPRRFTFLWTTHEILDVTSEVESDGDLGNFQLNMVAPLTFLRAAFADTCWHATQPMARLTIDDPLIRPRYGFLRFEDLLESLARLRYGVTLAFIPWNHRRTSPTVAARLACAGATFGLCAHGCDHTNHEFAYVDAPLARTLSTTAASRMLAHQRASGLGWDPVMIFPQGVFSAAAMRGIADAGFLGAVNSTCFPRDKPAIRISLRELMEPAVTRFSGVPMFRRRHPSDKLGLAFDLFIGRPALICEHHEYFRDGFVRPEELVKCLHRMEPGLQWPTLRDIAIRACRQRRSTDGWEVVFYSCEVAWRNPSDVRQTVRFSKHDPEMLVASVRVGENDLPFERVGEAVVFTAEVGPHAEFAARLECRMTDDSACVSGDSTMYRSKVALRRHLSELRDNWLSQYPALLWLARQFVRALRATGDSRRSD